MRFLTRDKQNCTHQVTFSRCAGLFDNVSRKALFTVMEWQIKIIENVYNNSFITQILYLKNITIFHTFLLKGWHKILLAVKNKEVSLYIDCVWIEDVSFNQSYPAMDTKGFVQIGHIVQNTSYSMPV